MGSKDRRDYEKREGLRKTLPIKREEFERARNLYMMSSLTRNEIASTVGVSPSTLKSWIDDYRWDEVREMHMAGPLRLEALMMENLKASIISMNKKIKEGEVDAGTSDAIQLLLKQSDTYQNLFIKTKKGEALRVLTELQAFIAPMDLDLSKELITYCDKFLVYLENKHNGN